MPIDVNIKLIESVDPYAQLKIAATGLPADAAIRCEIAGPWCEFARTLVAHVSIAVRSDGNGEAETAATLPDPCYWLPELPFLYELKLIAAESGEMTRRSFGLRRLTTRRQNLYWDSRRVVLRGAVSDVLTSVQVPEIRAAETALMRCSPTSDECAMADRFGIVILADLRRDAATIDDVRRIAEHPSVAAVMLRGDQFGADVRERLPQSAILAVAAARDSMPSEAASIQSWSRLVAVELAANDRPPGWIRDCRLPVIAIRRGERYADFQQARAVCDRLQAELAPEFDLAGYFV